MTIQVNLYCLLYVSIGFSTKFTGIVINFFLQLNYHHSHFLATSLNFTSFFTIVFLGATYFFTAGLFLDQISLLFIIICCKAAIMPLMVAVTILFFSLYRSALHVYHGNFHLKLSIFTQLTPVQRHFHYQPKLNCLLSDIQPS